MRERIGICNRSECVSCVTYLLASSLLQFPPADSRGMRSFRSFLSHNTAQPVLVCLVKITEAKGSSEGAKVALISPLCEVGSFRSGTVPSYHDQFFIEKFGDLAVPEGEWQEVNKKNRKPGETKHGLWIPYWGSHAHPINSFT